MAKVMFDTPTVCEKCGFHNFNIVGTVYNGVLNYTYLDVKCMRCGYKQIKIKQPNT